ncbi:hypothetical protein [Staphylococcus xylosus]|uniref:hypothetical protein n=1 Tax=Staphylococcus xylosus TaxID=1288 RepID=UPI00119E5C1E|nr:hypothetical protein [Staphylococcus xylosus]MCE7786056.1 hypothetical protein [Staphylococcus xylosus]
MKKLLLPLTMTGVLLLGACGNGEAEKKEDSKKPESVEKKKEAPKKSESKKDTAKKEDKLIDHTGQVTTKEPQSQEQQTQQPVQQEDNPSDAEIEAMREQSEQSPARLQTEPSQGELDENYINRDGEFYDRSPQDEKDKMARQLEAQESADEDDPRWDEQLEINMRDDLSDAERDQLSDEVWGN